MRRSLLVAALLSALAPRTSSVAQAPSGCVLPLGAGPRTQVSERDDALRAALNACGVSEISAPLGTYVLFTTATIAGVPRTFLSTGWATVEVDVADATPADRSGSWTEDFSIPMTSTIGLVFRPPNGSGRPDTSRGFVISRASSDPRAVWVECTPGETLTVDTLCGDQAAVCGRSDVRRVLHDGRLVASTACTDAADAMFTEGIASGRRRVGPTTISTIPGSGCVASDTERRDAAATVDISLGGIGLFNGVSAPRSWHIGCADARGRRLVWFWLDEATAAYFVVDARRARPLIRTTTAESLEFVAATELNGDSADEWIVVARGELTTNFGSQRFFVLGSSLSRALQVLPRTAASPPLPVRLASGAALVSDGGVFSFSSRGRLVPVPDGPEPSAIAALRAVTNEVAAHEVALRDAVYPAWRQTALADRRTAARDALVGLGVEAARAATLVDAALPTP